MISPNFVDEYRRMFYSFVVYNCKWLAQILLFIYVDEYRGIRWSWKRALSMHTNNRQSSNGVAGCEWRRIIWPWQVYDWATSLLIRQTDIRQAFAEIIWQQQRMAALLSGEVTNAYDSVLDALFEKLLRTSRKAFLHPLSSHVSITNFRVPVIRNFKIAENDGPSSRCTSPPSTELKLCLGYWHSEFNDCKTCMFLLQVFEFLS